MNAHFTQIYNLIWLICDYLTLKLYFYFSNIKLILYCELKDLNSLHNLYYFFESIPEDAEDSIAFLCHGFCFPWDTLLVTCSQHLRQQKVILWRLILSIHCSQRIIILPLQVDSADFITTELKWFKHNSFWSTMSIVQVFLTAL